MKRQPAAHPCPMTSRGGRFFRPALCRLATTPHKQARGRDTSLASKFKDLRAWPIPILGLSLLILTAGCGRTEGSTATQLHQAPSAGGGRLRIATTTSTADSGLLDAILPDFEARTGIKPEYIAVGTGQAIKLGEQGDVDVLLVHSPAAEERFVQQGHGVNRRPVMYNDFVVLGPQDDPAGVKGARGAAAAFAAIAAAKSRFVSRGDQSGTHSKEMAIWREAGVQPSGTWYVSAGQGMGEVLTMANEQLAYTLSDRGTYLSRRDGLDLVVLVEGDPILFNPYSVIAVNPARHPGVNFDAATRFIEWLTSVETQGLIGGFGKERYGQALFVPDADEWRAAQP